MPGSENQEVKIRLVAAGNKNENEPNFYFLKNSTAARQRFNMKLSNFYCLVCL